MMKEKSKPYVEIIEQPTSKGIRFRYQCEGRFAGSVMGVNNSCLKKTYPTIKIVNYKGPAFIVVSCVTKDPPYYPHPHNLVGKTKEISKGICFFKTESEDMIVSFKNLGIQCVRRKDIEKSLEERKRLQVDPYCTGFHHSANPDSIDLYSLRLCFQVFLEGAEKGSFNVALSPIVSDPIYDKKHKSELSIDFISHNTASVAGGTEMCILCERATRDDLEVIFTKPDISWKAIAELTPPGVHKQVSVVFKTPKYIDQSVNQPVNVYIQLRRISDGEIGDSVPFQLSPIENAMRKRKRASDFIIVRQIQAEAAKNADLISLAHRNNKNDDATEPWELPPLRARDPSKPSKSFIPVVTLRKNELSALRNQLMKPIEITNGLNNNLPCVPTTQQPSQQKLPVYQPINISNKSQQSENSSETLNSDGWIKEMLQTIDESNCCPLKKSYDPTMNTNGFVPGPDTHFVAHEQVSQNVLAQEINNFNELAPIPENSSEINISDILKDLVDATFTDPNKPNNAN